MIAALMPKRQLRVIQAERVQARGLQVMDVDRIGDQVIAEVVSLADDLTTANSAAGKQHREGERVMVAPFAAAE